MSGMFNDYPGVTFFYQASVIVDPADVVALWTPSSSNKSIVISDIVVTAYSPVNNGVAYIELWKGGSSWKVLPADNIVMPFSGWAIFAPGETLGYSSVAAGSYFISAQGSEY